MNIDDAIKQALKENTESITPHTDSLEKIKSKIKLNGSDTYMIEKRFLGISFNIKRIVIAASCGVLISCSTLALLPSARKVVADTWIRYVHGYTETKSYTTPQSNAVLTKDTGFDARVPETLTGGYKLIDTHIAGLVDGSSGKLEHKDSKELAALYTKDGSKTPASNSYIGLSEYTHELEAPKYKNIQKVTLGDKTAYYREFTLLTFNADSGIEPTKKDFEDQEAGKVLIVSTSVRKGEDVKEKLPDKSSAIMHELSWVDNGVNYVLTERGYNLNLKELSSIAQDMIKGK